MLIFNGPIAKEVGINAGQNAMGNYFRANAAIGRAVRLALVNIGAAIPGTGDMATAGTPAKFTFLRRGERSREPVGAAARRARISERGEHRDGDRGEGPHNVNDHESITAEGILTMIAGTDDDHRLQQRVLQRASRASHSVPSMRRRSPAADSAKPGERWLYERATLPMGDFRKKA
jgi:hypothetical protein